MRDRKGNLKGRKGIRKMTLPGSSQAKAASWGVVLGSGPFSAVPLSSSPGLGRWTATGTWVLKCLGYLASLGTSALAAGAPGRIPVKVPLYGPATVVLLCVVRV